MVMTRCDLKASLQCETVTVKASSVLRLINRHLQNLDSSSFAFLYNSFIRPHLECCVQYGAIFTKGYRGHGKDPKMSDQARPGHEETQLCRSVEGTGSTISGAMQNQVRHVRRIHALNKEGGCELATVLHENRGSVRDEGTRLKTEQATMPDVTKDGILHERVVDFWNQLPAGVVQAPSMCAFNPDMTDGSGTRGQLK